MLLLFLLVAAPFTYRITNMLFKNIGLPTFANGKPTTAGFIIHAIVFAVLVRVAMYFPLPDKKEGFGVTCPKCGMKNCPCGCGGNPAKCNCS